MKKRSTGVGRTGANYKYATYYYAALAYKHCGIMMGRHQGGR